MFLNKKRDFLTKIPFFVFLKIILASYILLMYNMFICRLVIIMKLMRLLFLLIVIIESHILHRMVEKYAKNTDNRLIL